MKKLEQDRVDHLKRLQQRSEAAKQLKLKKHKLKNLMGNESTELSKKDRIFQMFRLMDILDKMKLGPGAYNAYEYDLEDDQKNLNRNGKKLGLKKQRKFWSKDDSCMVDYTRDLKETIPRPRE